MRTVRGLAAIATIAAVVAGCTQIDRAVRGFETGPGGWSKVSESRTAMDSDLTYLGASADGLIIVQMRDGSTQIWRSGR